MRRYIYMVSPELLTPNELAEAMEPFTCWKCGAEVSGSETKCPNCGAKPSIGKAIRQRRERPVGRDEAFEELCRRMETA